MKALVRFLLFQELCYGVLILIFGISIGVLHDFDSGLKASIYSLIFVQFIIYWINRKLIRDLLNSKIKD